MRLSVRANHAKRRVGWGGAEGGTQILFYFKKDAAHTTLQITETLQISMVSSAIPRVRRVDRIRPIWASTAMELRRWTETE